MVNILDNRKNSSISDRKTFIAISNYGNMTGGGEHSFIDLVYRLNFSRNVVAVVPEAGAVSRKLIEKGISCHVIPMPPIRPWFAANVAKCLIGIYLLLKQNNAIFIYANGTRPAIYGSIAARLGRKPILWHCRVTERDPYLDGALIRACNLIVTNSHATGMRFHSYPNAKKKVHVVYNGLDLKWLTERQPEKPESIPDDVKVILMVSRISKWKRHDIAISAFESVADELPGAHLYFIGAWDEESPDWKGRVQKLSRLSPFSDRIHWIGYVSDIRPWYHHADIAVLPSEDEPFGRVLVEAMAFGVPVVAFRSGGVPEIIEHEKTGLLVEPGDIDAFGKAIRRLLVDVQLRNTVKNNAKIRANRFGIEQHVASMERIINSQLIKKG